MFRLALGFLCALSFVLGCESLTEPTNQELCEASDTCQVVGEGAEMSFECIDDLKWEDAEDPKNFTCISCEEGMKWENNKIDDLTCVPICKYPEGFSTDGIVLGEIAPPVAWDDAYLGDGTQTEFSFEEFYCDEDNDKVALIVFVSTGWCPNCPQYMEHVAEDAAILDAAGAKVIYWIMQDTGHNLATNEYANTYVNNYAGNDTFSLRVGDSTTKLIYDDGKTVEEQPGAGSYPYVPYGFVIKDNMKVVVDETGNDPEGPGIIYEDFLALLEKLKAGEYDDI